MYFYDQRQIRFLKYFSGKSQVRFPKVHFPGWDFHCDFSEKYSIRYCHLYIKYLFIFIYLFIIFLLIELYILSDTSATFIIIFKEINQESISYLLDLDRLDIIMRIQACLRLGMIFSPHRSHMTEAL